MSIPELINITAYCLEESYCKYPDHPAFLHLDGKSSQIWTYKELWDVVNRLASGFQQMGLPSQSRIMIRLPSSPDYVFAFFAAMLGGFVPIPSYEGLTEEEALFILNDAECALAIVSDNLPITHPLSCQKINEKALQKLKQSIIVTLPKTKAEDPALLVYTSGTTSRPKGVLHAHRMIWGRQLIRQQLLGIEHSDIVLHTDTLNFTYTYGILLMDPWPSGATAVLFTGKKEPATWLKIIRDQCVTIFVSTPSTYAKILGECTESSYNLPSLRHSITCGDVMRGEMMEKWEKQSAAPLYESLGMTEINNPISMGPQIPRKKGSIGKALDPQRLTVLQIEGDPTPIPMGKIGMLAIHRSEPRLMIGYWHRPEEEVVCFRGEWFISGDLVYCDTEGYYYYIGRKKNILKIEDDVVSPSEIEAIFENYPGIQEIGCWIVPSADQASILAIFVVTKKGYAIVSEELFKHAKAHLADYKCPKKVYFVTKLPRDSRGKLVRRKLPDII